ncbi:uncharacterized protein METZ01_LOCUS83426, partial [marine metagenome]
MTPDVKPKLSARNAKENNLLILIDGHALVHRSFHAIQQP